MQNWFGPCWNGNGKHILWQVGSEWSENLRERIVSYEGEENRIRALYEREQEEKLSLDDYAWLAERGQIVPDSEGRAEWQIVVLKDQQIREDLLDIGIKIREEAVAHVEDDREDHKEEMGEECGHDLHH